MKRYVVMRDFHLSILNRTIRDGDIIDMDDKQSLRVNGIIPPEAWSQEALLEALRVLSVLAGDESRGILALMEDGRQESPVSQTIAAFPVLGCLKATEEWLGRDLEWKTINKDQEEFMELFFEKGMEGMSGFTKKELRWIAAADVGKVNAWIKENGFDIQLGTDGSNDFAVASLIDIAVEWMSKGLRRKILNENGTFEGVSLKEKDGVVILQNPNVHPYPIAKIVTKSGDVVYMTPSDRLPIERFSLESKIRSIMVGVGHRDHRYEGVVFPMVDYDKVEDIGFLRGMTARETPWFIGEALQQTKFRMNEFGARVESLAAMSRLSFSKEPFVIDRPFMLWIMREGVDMPIFGGVFAEDVWNDPKTLGDKK